MPNEPRIEGRGYSAGYLLGVVAALFVAAIILFTLGIWTWNIAVSITGGPHV